MTRGYRVRPTTLTFLTGFSLVAALCVLETPVVAQNLPEFETAPDLAYELRSDWSDDVPAHVSYAEGEAWLERDGAADGEPFNVPLLTGDRLSTRQGRLEVLFSDGSVLTLDEQTEAELLSDTMLRLGRGRVRLDLSRAGSPAGYRIDTAGTTVWIRTAGEYRVEVNSAATDPSVRLLVVRGLAELHSSDGQTLVRAGHEAFASVRATPSLPYAVTVSRWDTFDRWWEARRSGRSGFASTRYLPAEVAYYSGELDRSGDWQYEVNHGYVWYPRVAHDWSPYSSGRWTYAGVYGWVWIGVDRWAWPTHHYGRWGVSGSRYYWIPGRQWAPAWVAWAATPTYVGWAPLGFDNRALISVSTGYSSGWSGWTYAPAHSFSGRIVVANRGRYLPSRGAAVSGSRGPGRPEGLRAHDNAGVRGPAATVALGTTAVPRSGIRSERSAPGALPNRSPRDGRSPDSAPPRAGTPPPERERSAATSPSRTTTPSQGAVRPQTSQRSALPQTPSAPTARPRVPPPSGGSQTWNRPGDRRPTPSQTIEAGGPSPREQTPATSPNRQPGRSGARPAPLPTDDRSPEMRPGVRQRSQGQTAAPSRTQAERSERTPSQGAQQPAPRTAPTRSSAAPHVESPRPGRQESGQANGARAVPRRRE